MPYIFRQGCHASHGGFPHSEIFGSKVACTYPKRIAACCVLHRLLVPRHSPCALCSLITHILKVVHLESALCPKICIHERTHTREKLYAVIPVNFLFMQLSKNSRSPPVAWKSARLRSLTMRVSGVFAVIILPQNL